MQVVCNVCGSRYDDLIRSDSCPHHDRVDPGWLKRDDRRAVSYEEFPMKTRTTVSALTCLAASLTVACAMGFAAQPDVTPPTEKPAESPGGDALLGVDVAEPVVTRPSAVRVFVTGAQYARITPEAPVLDGFGQPVDIAGIVVAQDEDTPIVFVVDPDIDYSVYCAVRYDIPDSDGNQGTEYFTLAALSERIDQVQALILTIIERQQREDALGPIGFPEVVEALERLRSSGALPGAQSIRTYEEALDEQ